MTLGGLLSFLMEWFTLSAALLGLFVATRLVGDALVRRWRWRQARREWSKDDRVSLDAIVRMREDRR